MVKDTKLKNAKRMFKISGLLLIGAGTVTLAIGILEIYCFYLFSEGGQFSYEGFGFGSFMFANLTFQILGYYGIAALALLLGYAHFSMRRWTKPMMLALMDIWVVIGLPMLFIFFIIAVTAKDLSLITIIALAVLLAAAYCLVPLLLRKFYLSSAVGSLLAENDAAEHLSLPPIRSLSVSIMMLFFAGMLHVPVMIHGIFPMFGRWMNGLPGILCLAVSIIVFLFFAWGNYQQYQWAHWGSLLWTLLLAISMSITFLKTSWLDLLDVMNFPEYEFNMLKNVPLEGWHLIVLLSLPMLGTFYLLFNSLRSDRKDN